MTHDELEVELGKLKERVQVLEERRLADAWPSYSYSKMIPLPAFSPPPFHDPVLE